MYGQTRAHHSQNQAKQNNIILLSSQLHNNYVNLLQRGKKSWNKPYLQQKVLSFEEEPHKT